MNEQDSMIEIFIYESQQLLQTLEDVLLQGEKEHKLNDEEINEVFRIMHTIKGSAAMMSFDNLASLSHAVEDLFSQIREKKARKDDWDDLFDIVLSASDMLKADIAKIQAGKDPDSDSNALIDKIHRYLKLISRHAPAKPDDVEAGDEFIAQADDPDAPYYKIKITFDTDCKMENMRAFGVVNSLKPFCLKMAHIPENLMAEGASREIVEGGFVLYIKTNQNPDDLKAIIDSTMFLNTFSLILLTDDSVDIPETIAPKIAETAGKTGSPAIPASDFIAKQNFISVNINKLDKLMDLVGEIVTTESMVTKNPEILNLKLESFERSAQQLRKLNNELQDIVMSIRMVPVSTTFHKMQRIVRDMSKKVNKEINLTIIGEETELDKNIIDSLSDPLMHLIRNAVDHGIESPEERKRCGKPAVGNLTLEARNTGGDVVILVSDDGKGLDRSSIIKKAIDKELTTKNESEISDKEAFSFIFVPGFSTNNEVTEYSGRGVGMDVVKRNIAKVGGTISVDSEAGNGTTFTIRIPLTLAIIDGMKLKVGNLIFIVPMLSIQESFKPNIHDVFLDPDGREMIMIRKEVYPIIRLHKLFNIEPDSTDLTKGILVMILYDDNPYCLYVDQLIGEQQAVIKPLPAYIKRHNENLSGIGGCAILGDGSISLIIDINNLMDE
ncbi:MAG: chemotaxis protein CheA [Clostridiales bacterium]|nr:chemotaxis protein CheA [Clostridiales bacterium]